MSGEYHKVPSNVNAHSDFGGLPVQTIANLQGECSLLRTERDELREALEWIADPMREQMDVFAFANEAHKRAAVALRGRGP